MKIQAIVINGRHGGTTLMMEYSPTLKLPIDREDMISIGEQHDNSVRMGDEIEYKECFRSVDKRCVLYSTSGNSDDINYIVYKIMQTYPLRPGMLL
jgi:hypothetical protein